MGRSARSCRIRGVGSPVASISRRRTSGSMSAASRAARSPLRYGAQTGLRMKGSSVVSRPNRTPIGRTATWACTGSPLPAATAMRSSTLRYPPRLFWLSEMKVRVPVSAATRANTSNSPSRSSKSETTSNAPRPVSRIALAIPISSAPAAPNVGVRSPLLVRWLSVLEVENPNAPAATPSRTRRPISAISSGVAASRAAPRSPMTKSRTAPWGTRAQTSTSRGRRSSAPRYSSKLSHSQLMPSCRAAPGMSSTPSINWISRSWSPTRTGAKPTPQLPMTTVVTPCHDEGASWLSQVAWPS